MTTLASEPFHGFCSPKSFRVGGVDKNRWGMQKRVAINTMSATNSRKQGITCSSNDNVPDTATLLSDPPRIPYNNTAPLVDALRASALKDVASFHFPGHNRGQAAPPSLSNITGISTFIHDLPELPELDDLFSPKGVILEAQTKAAELFGASQTWFLVGGSTCGIQASIMATCSPGKTLILPRNCHISAISGLVLSGAIPKYVTPEYSPEWDMPGGITPCQVEKSIKELEAEKKTVAAVLVTSPTYHGICSNISEIASVCHSYGIPVIVDEAHGAHFAFHSKFPCTSLQQGADIVVQSTHKVLSSLTQSSMLHMSGNLVDRDAISRCLQTLQSTSPSYLLLASLDATRAQLSENSETIFSEAMDLATEAKSSMGNINGISVLDPSCFSSVFPAIDPLRLTIGVSKLGISGFRAAEMLCEMHVVPELEGRQSVTFVVNLGTTRKHVQMLLSAVTQLSSVFYGHGSACSNKITAISPFVDISLGLSPREAFFAKKMKVGIRESCGMISGELISPYPPGIPVLVPGEVVNEAVLTYLQEMKRMGAVISGASDHGLSSLIVCDI
ncbi:hypothetical protein HPP92_002779 [Vanilla planifolia]|uniref:Orn/Lys/Arg decarboxylases family 1 pyridoxal-P attachment site domain-containing protein n=1 Tax=Vanilla planifolia TaxID=51239 RepID=A0A835S6X5_VANPL|nr:hypothetical protein HPP92_003174 [Vanilla planifolia]KAG0502707.1 hypothetical protein HPP92_002779 [Vanilla planifolia]